MKTKGSLLRCSVPLPLINNPAASVLAVLFALFFSFSSTAQCLPVPAQITCPVSGATALVNNDNIGTGITKSHTGTASFSNLTMNGGTLVVCGTLNLASFTFNSGTIYIAQGGTLNVNTSASIVFGANSTIYNYGTVYFASSIVTGSNNLVMNCLPTSHFSIPFNQFVLQGPNSYLVNNGWFNSNYFIVQSTNSASPVCSGPGSSIVTGILINQFANSFTSPSGTSCIQITNSIINSQQMTTNPSVNICYMAGSVSVSGSANFGNATVNSNCASCSVALPVGISGASANCYNGLVTMQWITDSEPNCGVYKVQMTSNGTDFHDAAEVQCQGASLAPREYNCEITGGSLTAFDYLRVKRSDPSGYETFSGLLQVDCSEGSSVNIYPTFITDEVITVKASDRIIAITMFSMDGRTIQQFDIEQNLKEISLNIGEHTAMGQYLLSVETETIRVDRLLRVAH